MRATVDPNAEIITINEIELVRSALDNDLYGVQYDLINSDGDTYRIQLSVVSEADEKHGKAVLSAVTESICRRDGIPDDVEIVCISETVSGPATDYMVLVNKRRSLPEGWETDLIRTTNSLNQELQSNESPARHFSACKKRLQQMA